MARHSGARDDSDVFHGKPDEPGGQGSEQGRAGAAHSLQQNFWIQSARGLRELRPRRRGPGCVVWEGQAATVG